MALASRLFGRKFLSINQFWSTSLCRSVTLVPRHAELPIQVPHDEKNMRLGRPLSPHISIYKFELPAVMSISHRITGMCLAGCFYGIALTSLACPKSFAEVVQSIPINGDILRSVISLSFAYHYFNGIRHLVWDTGNLLTLSGVYLTGWIMFSFAILGTIALVFSDYISGSASASKK